MTSKEQMNGLREQIDAVDQELLRLFRRRMEIVDDVARVKSEHNLPISDPVREEQMLARMMAQHAAGSAQGESSLLLRTLLALSKARQRRRMFAGETPLLPPPRAPKTKGVRCAHQGVPGAWSEEALHKVFPGAEPLAVEHFEDVFLAVRDGRVDYGVVPIENSQTGAIGVNYDLLRRYGCYVVGRTWVECRQCLLALEGAALSDIRVVQSHPEALGQCRRFLQDSGWEQRTCRNTAVAAEQVAASGDCSIAAIASRRAAERYGLAVLQPDIMDSAGNRTHFVVIASEPEYNERCNMVTVTFSTSHRSGALCETLMPFLAEGINLARIESRPGASGSYRFFADLEGNIGDAAMTAALRQAGAASEYFEVLGCYFAG